MGKKKTRRTVDELGWAQGPEGRTGAVVALARDTDRACALVAGEISTDWLEKYLRLTCHKSKLNLDSQHALLSEWNAPLLNFAVRIKVLRAFNMIGDATSKALTAIKDIRNVCAHHPGLIDFTDPGLEGEIRALSEFKKLIRPGLDIPWTTQPGAQSSYTQQRIDFMCGVVSVVFTINSHISKLKKGGRPKRL